jgi:tetratricopeptide (TPR) repeat protein
MTGSTSGHYTLWLLYSYLQQGRYAEARGVFEKMRTDVAAHPGYGKRLHLALARAAYMIDTREWDGDIAQTVVDTTDMDLGVFYLGLPEGWAALDRGDTTSARNLVDAMGARAAKLQADTSYALSNEPNDALVMMLELKGTLLLAQRQNDAAIALLKQAAAREDSVPYDFGPPATIKPPKELLGEALLATGSAAEARVAFERALARTPRRPAGLVGLADAARKCGAEDEATGALAELEKVWRGPADKRPKVVAKS